MNNIELLKKESAVLESDIRLCTLKDFIKTDYEIFCKILRNEFLKNPYRSELYKKYVRSQKKGSTFHHVLQAVYGMKASDLMGIALTPEEHALIQDNKITIENMVKAIMNMAGYIEYLEKKK